jgi:hypothetical protein
MKSSKHAKNKRSSDAASPLVRQLTGEEIAALAYSIWEKEGRPDGRDVEHWLQAELQVRGRGTIHTPPPSAQV